MWRIVQHDVPDDFVLATGETHSVREFVELAFATVGRTIEWRGSDVAEVGVDADNGDVLVQIDPRYFRPTEVDLLLGDSNRPTPPILTNRRRSERVLTFTDRGQRNSLSLFTRQRHMHIPTHQTLWHDIS